MPNKRCLVIYSGGLDTTVCIPLLREEGYAEVHTVTVDVGQPEEDISQAEQRAQILGANHQTTDAKAEFASKYCSIATQFHADYFGYPLSTAIARPLIAEKAAGIYHQSGPFDVIVHGCTGKGNDQFRIEYGLRRCAPDARIYAPIREHNWTRSEEIEYAEKVGAPIGQSKTKIWSIDENLWGRSIEGGRLEEPSYEPPEEIFAWTSSLQNAPNEPETVEIEFAEGELVRIGAETGSPLALIQSANRLAGKHGVGRIDMMEERIIGLKVRENYECPGALLLIRAHKELEALVSTPEERAFKAIVDREWANHVYRGLWGDPFFRDLQGFADAMRPRLSGKVWLRLFKGGLHVTARESAHALYSEAAASFDDVAFDQRQMTGMVQSHGMASILATKLTDGKA